MFKEKKNDIISFEILKILFILMIFEVPYFFVYLMIPIILFCYCIWKAKFLVPLSSSELFLAVFIISFYFIDTTLGTSIRLKILMVLGYILMYSSGRICGIYKEEKYLEKLIEFIAICYLSFVVISVLYSTYVGGFLISRNPINIWNGQSRPATHYGTMLVFPLAYGIYRVIAFTNAKIKGVVLIAIVFILTLILGSRTVLYLIPLGVIMGLFYELFIGDGIRKKQIYILMNISIVALLLLLVWYFDLFNIQEIIFKTALGKRFITGEAPSFKEDGRYNVIKYFFENYSKSIWGGAYIRKHMYNLHNVYLNIFDLSGIIPFVAFIAFNICVIKDIVFFNKYSKSISTKLCIDIFFSMFFLQMQFEPIMESVPIAMLSVTFLSGYIRSYRREIGK